MVANNIKKKILLLLLCSSIFTFILINPNLVKALGGGDPSPPKSPDLCAGGTGLVTAIGCVIVFKEDFTALASFFIQWGMGIAGGVAFILIVYAGFLITTSSGNPQRLNAGKELLSAAFSGLTMLIFSAFILRFVGQELLNLNLIGF